MQEIEFRNSKGLKLSGILNFPKGFGPFPLVIVLHGFGSNKEETQEFSEILNPLGVATFHFDFAGAGSSEGVFADKTLTGFIDDAISAINFVASLEKIDKNKLGIIGVSMGGTTAIIVASNDSRISTLVALVPAIYPADVIANLYDSEDFSQALEKGYIDRQKDGSKKRLNYNFFEDAKQYDIIQYSQNIHYKSLVIGAKHDDIVSLEQIEELANKVSNIELVTLPNSNHELEEDWGIVEQTVKEWFVNWLKE